MTTEHNHAAGRAPYPHCDNLVLHAPGECRYCDMYPEKQEFRQTAGLNFTGHGQDMASARRDVTTINLWPGNRPYPPATGVHTFDRVGDKQDLRRIILTGILAEIWVCCRCSEVRGVWGSEGNIYSFTLNHGVDSECGEPAIYFGRNS